MKKEEHDSSGSSAKELYERLLYDTMQNVFQDEMVTAVEVLPPYQTAPWAYEKIKVRVELEGMVGVIREVRNGFAWQAAMRTFEVLEPKAPSPTPAPVQKPEPEQKKEAENVANDWANAIIGDIFELKEDSENEGLDVFPITRAWLKARKMPKNMKLDELRAVIQNKGDFANVELGDGDDVFVVTI